MLYDKEAPNRQALILITGLTNEQYENLKKECDLDKFDFDSAYAVIMINAGNYMYLNIRDPGDRDLHRDAKLLTALKPVGWYRGNRGSAQMDAIQLMKTLAAEVEWRPCSSRFGPTHKFVTCYNSSAAMQMFCPPLAGT